MEISIIIPVYNKIKYIRSLLGMISNQTFADYECILVDDGSTDGCSNVCDEFSQNDSRFKCVHISNSGVSNARNVGLCHASGKYVTFIDADDEIPPNYLDTLYNDICNYDVDMVICSYQRICDYSGWTMKVQYGIDNKIYTFAELLPRFMSLQREKGIFGWCWGKIVRRDIIGDTRFDESIRLAEDFEFYLKVYPKIKTIYYEEKKLYRYRVDSENGSMISAADDKIDYYSQLLIFLRCREFLRTQDAFCGENEQILNEQLSKYVFFTLFHKELNSFMDEFYKVRDVWKANEFPLYGFSISSKIILACVKHNWGYAARYYLKMYRTGRWILKRHKRRENVD